MPGWYLQKEYTAKENGHEERLELDRISKLMDSERVADRQGIQNGGHIHIYTMPWDI